MNVVRKIVVIGPESTGKSTLCQKLADHYNSLWVPEYAREYLEINGPDYKYEDLLTIAKGQLDSEDKITLEQMANNPQPSTFNHQPSTVNPQPSIIFIDTDLYVMKVWSEFVFNKCSNWVLNRIAERNYDLYLLCDVDLPWVEDLLREYPDEKIRKKLFYFYKDLMVNQLTPWCIISGNYEERFEKAIRSIEESFTKKRL